jgi:hypothetical protein
MKKWTEEAVAEIYSTILPTKSPMANLNNIIFNYSVNEFLKIHW